MKKFHLPSFVLGLLAGIVLLTLSVTRFRLVRGSHNATSQRSVNSQQFQNGSGQPRNLSRMAERLGITEVELQKELDSGKTMQEIATEYGVDFSTLRGPRGGSGALRTASGALMRTATGARIRQSAFSPQQ